MDCGLAGRHHLMVHRRRTPRGPFCRRPAHPPVEAMALCCALLGVAHAAAPAAPEPAKLLLFTDRREIAQLDERLQLTMNPATKGERVITPTEPWESWAVFAYNSVVQVREGDNRMYYDCIEGSGVPPGGAGLGEDGTERSAAISKRRICLATSADGKNWIKPKLGLYNRSGSTANNILLEDSGNGVFLDLNPKTPSAQKWKMVCSNAVYASPDGLHWSKIGSGSPVKAADDTKPTGYFDPKLGKYVISVRRDLDGRKIGRCVTDDFTRWESEVPGGEGCPVVLSTDESDPGGLDIYTNAWTPYPSIDSPVVHLFFPSYYHHFSRTAPWGFGNDGLLDIRLIVSRDGEHLNYTSTANARQPFVPLGINDCGASTPSVRSGWCSPYSGIESHTSFDTSAMYMASGYIPSADGHELYFYSSGQAFTHGGDSANHTWGNQSGIRLLSVRRDGFVSVNAPYFFPVNRSLLPALTTVDVEIPTGCPPPHRSPLPEPNPKKGSTGCSYEHPSGKCDNGYRNISCQSQADCDKADKTATCKGKKVECLRGYCQSGVPGGVLCVAESLGPPPPPTMALTGGVQLLLNVETSVAGYAVVEVVGALTSELMTLESSDPIKGSSVSAVASWGGGALASLSGLAGKKVQFKVAMADARLFSIKLACAAL